MCVCGGGCAHCVCGDGGVWVGVKLISCIVPFPLLRAFRYQISYTMAFNDETTEDFAKRMTQVVSNGHTCVAMTLGEKTGLWKIMAGLKEPKTCQEIAKISGMKEKYEFVLWLSMGGVSYKFWYRLRGLIILN